MGTEAARVKNTIKTEEMLEMEKQFRIQMQREMIFQKLKEKGFRVTKQRIAVIDIILENDCCSCKEIFYKTSKNNRHIGTATIYRTINMLEEIGAIDRKNLYRFSYEGDVFAGKSGVAVILQDGTEHHFSPEEWKEVLRMGMRACGYAGEGNIISVLYTTAEGKN